MTAAEPRVDTVRRTAAAILVANAVAAASSWLVFLAIARLESFDAAGEYSIVMAVATPVFFFFVSGMRPARLADPHARLDSSEDWMARAIGSVLAVAACTTCLAVGLVSDVAALLAVGAVAARCVDAIAEAPYTCYQKARRTRPLLISSTTRSIVLVVSVVVSIAVLGGSSEGLLVGAALSLGIIVAFDVPRALKRGAAPGALRRAFGIVHAGVPLGVASLLVSLTLNVPRIALGSARGDAAAGRFAAITVLFAVASLVTTAASHTAIPVLARARADAAREAFGRVMRKLLLLGVVLGIAAVGISATVGPSVLSFVFGESFEGERFNLVLMAIALAIACLTTLMQDGLTALGVHRTQVLVFGAGAVVVLACSFALIPSLGTRGAAIAVVAATSVQFALCSVALIVGVRRAFPAPAVWLSP